MIVGTSVNLKGDISNDCDGGEDNEDEETWRKKVTVRRTSWRWRHLPLGCEGHVSDVNVANVRFNDSKEEIEGKDLFEPYLEVRNEPNIALPKSK